MGGAALAVDVEKAAGLAATIRTGTSLELFAGAGGLALGLQRAGFAPKLVAELDPRAVATLRANGRIDRAAKALWPIEEVDVKTLTFEDFADVDLVAAGPPCQPFSIGGLRKGRHDDRDLLPEAIRAVREAKPKAFLIENVRGLTFPAIRPYLEYCIAQLKNPSIQNRDEDEPRHWRLLSSVSEDELEYRVDWALVNAADYGLPQQRVRLVIIGLRVDQAGWTWPERTHSRTRLLEAIGGDAYWEDHGIDAATRQRARIAALAAKTSLRVQDHTSGARWRTVRDALNQLGEPGDYSGDTNHVVVDGARLYKKHRGSVLDWPAKTVKAGVHGTPGGEHIVLLDDGSHRYFTVRECAALQGFPRDYVLPTLRSVALRQLGNAVPVDLAEVFGRQLLTVLNAPKEATA